MDLNKLDAELNVKIVESIKELLKKKDVKINFDIPNDTVLEASTVSNDNNKFRLLKRKITTDIYDINEKYLKFIPKKILNNTRELSQPQAIEYVMKKTRYLFFLRPFLGKKKIKKELISISHRINYNSVIIEIEKQEYDRLNYYTKYVYKLQQLHKLNFILGIDQTFNVVFDDDKVARDLYNSMYDSLNDILKPPNKK